MDLQLQGRAALITGPAKGMGAAITRAFAAEGCRLVLVGRDLTPIEEVAREVTGRGAEAVIAGCDLPAAVQCAHAAAAGLS